MIRTLLHPCRSTRRPAGFTLVELLITVSIIGIMASMMLFALWGAQESAKEHKTKALIAKLDAIIKAKWEAFQTRRVPIADPLLGIPNPSVAQMNGARFTRLRGLRDLMRMELPDRWSDIVVVTQTSPGPPAIYNVSTTPAGVTTPVPTPPAPPGPTQALVPTSSVWNGYLRRVRAATSTPSLELQGAECLYLIVTSALQEDSDGSEIFRPNDIGDVDGDGFPEFIDGWGQAIRFVRWPAGFQNSELQIVARGQATNSSGSATVDMTDPVNASFSTSNGSYVGGAIIVTGSASPFSFVTSQRARITGYTVSGGIATISYAPSAASISGNVVVTNPDPFDPAASDFTLNASVTFATYPLIYSPGPDKCYGIDNPSGFTLTPPPGFTSDLSQNLNPVFINASGAMFGDASDNTNEDNFVTNGWVDNIHNHMIGKR